MIKISKKNKFFREISLKKIAAKFYKLKVKIVLFRIILREKLCFKKFRIGMNNCYKNNSKFLNKK